MNRAGNAIRGEHLYENPKCTKRRKAHVYHELEFRSRRALDGHIAREYADCDVDATMETMVAEPYVHCVATLAGCGKPTFLRPVASIFCLLARLDSVCGNFNEHERRRYLEGEGALEMPWDGSRPGPI
jgi:hypothetical protein